MVFGESLGHTNRAPRRTLGTVAALLGVSVASMVPGGCAGNDEPDLTAGDIAAKLGEHYDCRVTGAQDSTTMVDVSEQGLLEPYASDPEQSRIKVPFTLGHEGSVPDSELPGVALILIGMPVEYEISNSVGSGTRTGFPAEGTLQGFGGHDTDYPDDNRHKALYVGTAEDTGPRVAKVGLLFEASWDDATQGADLVVACGTIAMDVFPDRVVLPLDAVQPPQGEEVRVIG